MKRKKFYGLCVAAVLPTVAFLLGRALPLEAQSSQHRVAVLTPGLSYDPAFQGLREGLARLGYEERKNITFILEETKGAPVDAVRAAAKKLAEARPDVLFTVSTSHTGAAKQATTSVPVVFTWVGDPLRSGFIDSYASSKNNLTGVSIYSVPLSGKRLEILKEIDSKVKRVLAMGGTKDVATEASQPFLDEAGKKLGIQVLRQDLANKEEIEKLLLATPKGSVDALYHIPSSVVGTNMHLLIKKSLEDRIPLVVYEVSLVEKGALVAYGGDMRLLGVQSAGLVAKILKGAHPSALPVETPERNVLAINLTTAKALGLKIPREVLDKADRLMD